MYKIYPLKLVKVMKNHISQLVGLIGLDGPSIGSILSSILNVIRVINNALRFAKNTSPLSAILTRSVVVVGFHMRSDGGVVFVYRLYKRTLISDSSYGIIP